MSNYRDRDVRNIFRCLPTDTRKKRKDMVYNLSLTRCAMLWSGFLADNEDIDGHGKINNETSPGGYLYK